MEELLLLGVHVHRLLGLYLCHICGAAKGGCPCPLVPVAVCVLQTQGCGHEAALGMSSPRSHCGDIYVQQA